MNTEDKEAILRRVEAMLTESLRYMEVMVSYREAEGYTRIVRLPLFDENYAYPVNKEAVQDE